MFGHSLLAVVRRPPRPAGGCPRYPWKLPLISHQRDGPLRVELRRPILQLARLLYPRSRPVRTSRLNVFSCWSPMASRAHAAHSAHGPRREGSCSGIPYCAGISIAVTGMSARSIVCTPGMSRFRPGVAVPENLPNLSLMPRSGLFQNCLQNRQPAPLAGAET